MESSPSTSSSSSSVLPPLISNSVASSSNSSSARELRRRKKKMKTQTQQSLSSLIPNSNDISDSQTAKFSWKSESTHQFYTNKLLRALRHVNSSSSSTSKPRRGRAVKEAADRALAIAARGRRRWSRAILAGRLRLKFMNKTLKRQRVRAVATPKKPRTEMLNLKVKNLPAVQRKVKTLSQLVPGCRKEPLPVILEETTDYIPALEMQVRVMREILALFGGASAGGNAGEGSISGPTPPENGSV